MALAKIQRRPGSQARDHSDPQEVGVTHNEQMDTLQRVLDGFNAHDLEAILSHFAEDCVFEAARGPEPWGRRFTGKEEIRRGFGALFENIPDVHFGDDSSFIAGNRAVSEWTITGTTVDGERLELRGCDLWTFGDDGRIVRKDGFMKRSAT